MAIQKAVETGKLALKIACAVVLGLFIGAAASAADTETTHVAAKNQATANAEEQVKKTAQPEGNWSYDFSKDEITQKDSWMAFTTSVNSLFLRPPYGGEQKAGLALRQSPRHGKDVIVRIQRGQIICDSYYGCPVLVRFDDQPPEKYHARTAADHSSEVLFLNHYDRFLKKTLRAKKAFVEITVYQNGNIILEFDVANLKQNGTQAQSAPANK